MKKIFILFPILILLAGLVTAIGVPHPIYGHVTSYGTSYDNLDIKVTNLDSRNQDSTTTKTQNNGFYQVELPNFSPTWRDGDSIEVRILFCEGNNQCVKTTTVSGGGNQVDFDITEQSILPTPSPTPEPEVITKTVYENGTKIIEKTIVEGGKETIIERKIVKYVCSDGSEVDVIDDCPKEKKDIWAYLIDLAFIILGALGFGAGFVGMARYWYKRGSKLIKHGKKLDDKDMIEKGERYQKRAIKMLGTAIKRAKEGKYKK